MKLLNFDQIINGSSINKNYTKNIFCLSHPSNTIILGKTNSGKTNILMNLIYQNPIYEKIYIYTNNLDCKYEFLKNKFKDDVFIYIDDINFSKIDKKFINLVIFDDLVFSDKKISTFFTQSRKLNVSCVFISHRYFTVDRLLRNNIDYIIFTKLDKKELNLIYQDQDIDVDISKFQKINYDLKPYENLMIDKNTSHDFMKLRKNFNEILNIY